MATRIRLRRVGRKKLPLYRIVIADQTAPRDGRFIDIIGTYNPRGAKREDKVQLDLEKAKDSDDKSAIESKIANLEQVAQSLYAAAQSGGASDTAQQSAPGGGSAQPDDVVDAEFTEVKDDKK